MKQKTFIKELGAFATFLITTSVFVSVLYFLSLIF